MSPQRDTLSDALRELGSASPQASPALQSQLGEAYVRHHARRQLRQGVAAVMALAVCVGISLYWLTGRGQVARRNVVEPAPTTAQTPPAAPQIVAPAHSPELPQARTIAKSAAKPHLPPSGVKRLRNVNVDAPATVEAADFIALPTFDPAIPVGESRLVRMDLPASDLQLIGYPVDGQLLDRRIVTDVLVGQDGMPYAVRLVQTRNVH